MRSTKNVNSSRLPNAFSPTFLDLFDERDEPPTAKEADTAGPWSIQAVEPARPIKSTETGPGFGLFRTGEEPPDGFPPVAVFKELWAALLAAAILPGTGRDPLFFLDSDAGPEGYAIRIAEGEVVGRLTLFDQAIVDDMNMAVSLVRSPIAIAFLLECAGPTALERCGAILKRRVAAENSAAE